MGGGASGYGSGGGGSNYHSPTHAGHSYAPPAATSSAASANAGAAPPCAACNLDIPVGAAATVGGKRYHKAVRSWFVFCMCARLFV